MTAHFEPLDIRCLYAAGAIDTSFGKHGSVRLSFSVPVDQSASAYQVIVDGRGRTYVVAELNADGSTQSYQIERLTAAGAVDATWAAAKHGRLKFDWTKNAGLFDVPTDVVTDPGSRFRVAVDAADRLVVLDGTTLVRYAADGTADAGFGDRGSAALSKFRYTDDLTIAPDNKILVAGAAVADKLPRMAVERLLSRGKPDATFGRKGLYTAPAFGTLLGRSFVGDKGFDTRSSYGMNLRRLDDGSVMLAGDGQDVFHDTDRGSDFNGRTAEADGVQAVKLTARGRADGGYGTGGVAESAGYTGMPSYDEIYTGVVGIRPDGAVVAYSFTEIEDQDTSEVSEDHNNLLMAGKGGRVTDTTILNLNPADTLKSENGIYHATFLGPAAGPYVTLSDGGLFRQGAGGRFDKSFNGGTPIDVDAIAAGPNDTVVAVSGTRFANRLSIGRLLLN